MQRNYYIHRNVHKQIEFACYIKWLEVAKLFPIPDKAADESNVTGE